MMRCFFVFYELNNRFWGFLDCWWCSEDGWGTETLFQARYELTTPVWWTDPRLWHKNTPRGSEYFETEQRPFYLLLDTRQVTTWRKVMKWSNINVCLQVFDWFERRRCIFTVSTQDRSRSVSLFWLFEEATSGIFLYFTDQMIKLESDNWLMKTLCMHVNCSYMWHFKSFTRWNAGGRARRRRVKFIYMHIPHGPAQYTACRENP